MAKLILSIETGIWWTKVALVEDHKKSHNIVNAFFFRTPEHAVEDGYIRDKEAFANVLKAELLNRQIQEKNVIFSINSSKVITREITIPFVKDDKIETIVESQAKDYFPMDVSGYTISYTKMGMPQDADHKKNLKLLLIAIPDNLLSNYSSFASEAGLNILNFEYIGNSVVSFIKEHYTDDGVVVQLEEQSTVISIIANKQLVFQRVSPYGYETSLASVIEHKVLGAEDEIQAFDFLVSHDVLNVEPNAGDYPYSTIADPMRRQEVLEDAYTDVRDALVYYVRVVITALDYYKSQTKTEQLGKLYLAGDGIRFAGIQQMFLRETGLQLEERDFFSYVNFKNKNILNSDRAINSLGFVSIVGATIHPINAKPKELKAQESKKGSLKTAYIVFFGAFAISLVMIVLGVTRKVLATTQQAFLQQRLDELSYVQVIFDENEAAATEAAQYRAFDAATYTNNEQFSELISQLEQNMPNTITVISLTITGDNISINMVSDNRPSVALLIMNMKKIPCLTNVSVLSLVEDVGEDGSSTWSFSATATYVKVTEETTESAVE